MAVRPPCPLPSEKEGQHWALRLPMVASLRWAWRVRWVVGDCSLSRLWRGGRPGVWALSAPSGSGLPLPLAGRLFCEPLTAGAKHRQ